MKRFLTSNAVNVTKHQRILEQHVLRAVSANQFKKRVNSKKIEESTSLNHSNLGRAALERFRAANSHRIDRVATASSERQPEEHRTEINEKSKHFVSENPVEFFLHTVFTSRNLSSHMDNEKVQDIIDHRVDCYREYKLFMNKIDYILHRLALRKKTIAKHYKGDQVKGFDEQITMDTREATLHIEVLFRTLFNKDREVKSVDETGLVDDVRERALEIEKLERPKRRAEALLDWYFESLPDRYIKSLTGAFKELEKILLKLKTGQKLRMAAHYLMKVDDQFPVPIPSPYHLLLSRLNILYKLIDRIERRAMHNKRVEKEVRSFKKSMLVEDMSTLRSDFFPLLMQTIVTMNSENRKNFVKDIEEAGFEQIASDIKYYYLNFNLFRRYMQSFRKRQKIIAHERQKVNALVFRDQNEMTTDIAMKQLIESYEDYMKKTASHKNIPLDIFEDHLYEGKKGAIMFDFGFYSMYFFEGGELGWDEHRQTGFRTPTRTRESLERQVDVQKLMGKVKEMSRLYRIDQSLLHDQMEVVRRLVESGEIEPFVSGLDEVKPMPISENDKTDLTVQSFVKNLVNNTNSMDVRFSRPKKIRPALYNDEGNYLQSSTREEMLRLRKARTAVELTPQNPYNHITNLYRVLDAHHAEFEETLIDMSRVVQQQKTGRIPSFRAYMLIGHKDGMVGFGKGKGPDPPSATLAARRNAYKNLRSYDALTADPRGIVRTQVRSKHRSSLMIITPSPYEAVAAHPILKKICGYIGITHCAIKLYKSKRAINIIPNLFKALDSMYSSEFEMAARGKMSVPRFERYYGSYVEDAHDLSKYGYSHNNKVNKHTHDVTF